MLAMADQIPGFMEPEELAWLHEAASQMETVVEIGTWKGRSAAALASAGRVVTIDHFEGSPGERQSAHAEALTTNLRREAELNLASLPNVSVLTLASYEAARLFNDRSVDMVFIDGDHEFSSVLIDLLLWRPKARRLICGHDKDWEGVYRALAVYGLPYQPGPGSIWHAELIDG